MKLFRDNIFQTLNIFFVYLKALRGLYPTRSTYRRQSFESASEFFDMRHVDIIVSNQQQSDGRRLTGSNVWEILRWIARKAGIFLLEGRDWRLGAKISASSIPTFCFAKNPGASPFYLGWKGFRSGSLVQAFSNLLYTPATSLSDLRFCLYGGISAGMPSLTESRNPDEKVSPFIQARNAPKGRNFFLPSSSLEVDWASRSSEHLRALNFL